MLDQNKKTTNPFETSEDNLRSKIIEIGILFQSILTLIAFILVGVLKLTFQSFLYKVFLFILVIIALSYILFLKFDFSSQ